MALVAFLAACGARTPLGSSQDDSREGGPIDAGPDANGDSGCADICRCPFDVAEGPFSMGDPRGAPESCLDYDACDRDASCDHVPQHEVYESAFRINRFEATAACYSDCVSRGGCTDVTIEGDGFPLPSYWSERTNARRPAYGLSQAQADAYCAFLGGRLPTESEWEKAARGLDDRAFPWGDELPDCDHADLGRGSLGACLLEDDDGIPLPVDSWPLGASPWGAEGMSGGVKEWVADEYDPGYYDSAEDWRDPINLDPCPCERCPPSGVRRGGSLVFGTGDAALGGASVFARDPGDGGNYVGVRCAWDPN